MQYHRRKAKATVYNIYCYTSRGDYKILKILVEILNKHENILIWPNIPEVLEEKSLMIFIQGIGDEDVL
jgi:hypothetical protein